MNRVYQRRIVVLALATILGSSLSVFGAHKNQKPNVILLVLDQLQADRLHCFGNPRPTSPNIDRLAQRGVRFSHFYSVAPWTSPSYSTLMTSLYPSRHGVTLFWRPGMPLIDKDTPMLAQVFQGQGYHTAAFVNNGLAGEPLTGRGFEEFYEGQHSAAAANITQRAGLAANALYTAPATIQQLLPWLDQHRSEHFFLWILFWEPHSPFNPPPEHDLFKSDAYPYLSDTGYDVANAPLKRLATLGDRKAVERLYQLYDGKIHFIDSYVGQLLDHLRELGLEDKTLVFLTSDHGELMYTHSQDYLTSDHRSPYDPVMHIPFVLAGPDVPKGQVVEGLASNLDSAPTILDLAGLPPLTDAQGRSLVPMIQGRTESVNRYVYGEEDTAIPWRSIRTERYKLVRNLWSGEKRLFDLRQDPAEQTNVAQQNPSTFRDLESHLEEWMRENQPSKEIQRARWKIYTQPDKTLVVDDQTIGGRMLLTGQGWHSDTSPESGNYEVGCFWTEAGDGSRTAVWRSDDPLIGTYKIYVFFGHPAPGHLATNAPFTIVTETGSKTVHVNFNHAAGQWNLLGTFEDPRYVSVSDAADGAIVVDAVKFERLD